MARGFKQKQTVKIYFLTVSSLAKQDLPIKSISEGSSSYACIEIQIYFARQNDNHFWDDVE